MNKKEFFNVAFDRLLAKYGEDIDVRILNRFYSEKNWISDISNEWFLDVLAALSRNAKEHAQKIQVLGSYGSLFVSYLLGITNENPLPLHYFCPKCKRVEFVDELLSPMDLETKPCVCGADMVPDGYDIPFQLFNGYKVNCFASIEVTKDYLETAKSVISSHLSETCKVVSMYYGGETESYKLALLPSEIDFKDVPKKPEVLQSQYPCISLDVSKELTAWCFLESYTSDEISDDCWSGKDLKTTALKGNLGEGVCVYNSVVIDALRKHNPRNYFEFIKLQGLMYGSNTYEQADSLLDSREFSLTSIPAYREDLYCDLCQAMSSKDIIEFGLAHHITSVVRKGQGNDNAELIANSLSSLGFYPSYIQYVTNISYMFTKAHGVAVIKRSLALLWYAIRYPEKYLYIIKSIGLELETE